jgi:hypothetical protein
MDPQWITGGRRLYADDAGTVSSGIDYLPRAGNILLP